jgi:hypothetical protein
MQYNDLTEDQQAAIRQLKKAKFDEDTQRRRGVDPAPVQMTNNEYLDYEEQQFLSSLLERADRLAEDKIVNNFRSLDRAAKKAKRDEVL